MANPDYAVDVSGRTKHNALFRGGVSSNCVSISFEMHTSEDYVI